jgi:hypothetical protein
VAGEVERDDVDQETGEARGQDGEAAQDLPVEDPPAMDWPETAKPGEGAKP